MDRISLVNRAKELAGPVAFPLILNYTFDVILTDISTRYPVLKNQLFQGTTVDGQDYQSETFPPFFRLDFENTQMFLDYDPLRFVELEEYLHEYRTSETITESVPDRYAIDIDAGRIYFWSRPDDEYAYQFYHTITHPPASRMLSFTSGGTYEIRPGITITGITSSKTAYVNYVKVTSGTWAAGTAAGTLYLTSQTGAFVSEVLVGPDWATVTEQQNIANVSGDSSTDDAFVHLLGQRFDNAIINGLTWKACELCNPPQIEKAILFKQKYETELFYQAVQKSTKKPSARANFWQPTWGRGRW